MKEDKIRVLKENYKNEESDISFVEFVKLCSESDPGFFRWLFDDDDLEDCDEGDHAEEWEQFLAGLRFGILIWTRIKKECASASALPN